MTTMAAPGAVARTMFRRMSAHAMGMKATALCHKSHLVPKSTRSACSNCKHTFGLWHGKHHCRLCGEVVCRNCSTKRIMFRKKSVRCCDDCVATNVERISLDQQQASRPYGSESASLTAAKRRNATMLSSSSPKSQRSEYSYSRRYSTPSRVEVHGPSVRVSLDQPKQQLNSSIEEEKDKASANNDIDAAASKTSSTASSDNSWQNQMPYFVAALAATVVGVISAMT